MEILDRKLENTRHMILRLEKVKEKTGLSRSTIYLWISEGNFPKQIKLGGRSVGWLESDIDEWIMKKIELQLHN